MGKIKFTKTELKAQLDALKQFSRFLPTLQLKKQQLQLEVRKSVALLEANRTKQRQKRADLEHWVALFSDEFSPKLFPEIVKLESVDSDLVNIAGVNVPVFAKANFALKTYDLFGYDSWVSDGVNAVKMFISLQEEYKILSEQNRLLVQELRTTTQRVNLFEKVKIPECKNNIRRIRIYLGDLDTAGVARSKIAKRKTQEAQQV